MVGFNLKAICHRLYAESKKREEECTNACKIRIKFTYEIIFFRKKKLNQFRCATYARDAVKYPNEYLERIKFYNYVNIWRYTLRLSSFINLMAMQQHRNRSTHLLEETIGQREKRPCHQNGKHGIIHSLNELNGAEKKKEKKTRISNMRWKQNWKNYLSMNCINWVKLRSEDKHLTLKQ